MSRISIHQRLVLTLSLTLLLLLPQSSLAGKAGKSSGKAGGMGDEGLVGSPVYTPVAAPVFPPTLLPVPVATLLPLPVPAATLAPVPIVDGEQVDGTPPQQTFESTLILSVSANIVVATDDELALLAQNFIDSYNIGQTDPAVCDPFERVLEGVSKIQTGFNHRRRNQEVFNNTNINITQGTITPVFTDIKNSPPIITGLSNLLLVVTGRCSGCSSGTMLFNEVSGRRLVGEESSNGMAQERSLQTVAPSAPTACTSGPSTTAVLAILAEQNALDGLSAYEVFDITQIEDGSCPAPSNTFTNQTYTFTLEIPPLSFPQMTFHDTMYHLTEENNFGEYFNAFTTLGFCDPLFRRINIYDFVGAEVGVDRTIMTFVIGGTCNGCSDLWGGPAATRRRRSLRQEAVSSKRKGRKGRGQRKLSAKHDQQLQQGRNLQSDDICYCAEGVLPRGPSKEEFEAWLTEKFFSIALSTP
jgi:hypothetical protein